MAEPSINDVRNVQAAMLRNAQRFPVYYPGEAEFQDSQGSPSGAVGATATVSITLNTRPHNIIGVRVSNTWNAAEIAEADVNAFNPLFQSYRDLKRLDREQDMEIDLAQQNVIVRRAYQGHIVGPSDDTVWHPFPVAYPFRGGNNVVVVLRRIQPYPLGASQQEVIFPRVKVTLVALAFVDMDLPPGSPPVTDMET